MEQEPNQLANLAAQVQKLELQVAETSILLEAEKQEKAAHRDAADASAAWAKAVANENAGLRTQLEAANAELDRLGIRGSTHGSPSQSRSSVSSLSCSREEELSPEDRHDSSSFSPAMPRALADKDARIADLQAQVDHWKAEMANTMHNAELAAAEVCSKVDTLTRHMEVINIDLDMERQRAEEAEGKATQLRKSLAVEAAKSNETKGKAMVLEANLRAAETHISKLSKELAEMRNEKEQLDLQLQETEYRIQRRSEQIQDLEDSNRRLGERLSRKHTDLVRERYKHQQAHPPWFWQPHNYCLAHTMAFRFHALSR
mmetsp:Transcript_326/g.994  ORF Transcript_326/g.994 Transcript_326/m.994 type:complete len:316 (-) Transcript_326:788-1735(-)